MRAKISKNEKDILEDMKEFVESPAEETATLEPETERNRQEIDKGNTLSSGSALLNLACTDTPWGAFIPGRYYLLVGSSSAGKTWMMLSIAAESTLHDKFKDYRIVLDETEEGNNIDVGFYFGKNVSSKIRAPKYDEEDNPVYSTTIEEFYDNINRELDKAEEHGYGLIYMLDSMDALTSAAEIKKTDEQREAREKGRETTGSMGDGKAKVNSQNLRRVCSRLNKTGSMLFIICQERDNIGSMVASKTFSGGNALLFYATLQIWLTHKQEIKATIKGHTRTLGNISKIAIKKNRLTGQRHRDLELPFYHSFGIDDTGSLIDWLVEEKHWSGGAKETAKIQATEFDVELNKEQLARHIESLPHGRKKLYKIVYDVWKEIKQDIEDKVVRKPRY